MCDRKRGYTSLGVSPIALNCKLHSEPDRGRLRWSLKEEESRALIGQAVEAGINFFDTTNTNVSFRRFS